jgi:hypothetical protein
MTHERYGAGEAPAIWTVGDFLLVSRRSFAGAAVTFGQGLRFRGERRAFARWNHVALVADDGGGLVEALPRLGAHRSHASEYLERDYTVVHTGIEDGDTGELVYFANYIVGEKYGFVDDVSVFLSYLTGGKLSVCTEDRVMCSELVCRALERGGYYFPRLPQMMAPADLAEFFGVSQ